MTQFDALIVSHGQPSDPDPAERSLAALRTQVQMHLNGLRLGAATMAKPEQLETQLARLRPGGVVYPLFMSDGWFVQTALARRLGDAPVEVAAPFGIDPALPSIIRAALADHGAAGQKTLLLVAHGSASGRPGPARSAYDFAQKLEQGLPGLKVAVGFLEQAPKLVDVANGVAKDSPCLPFFAMEGDHVRLDLTGDLAKIGFAGPVLPVMTQFRGSAQMIARAITARCEAQLDRQVPLRQSALG